MSLERHEQPLQYNLVERLKESSIIFLDEKSSYSFSELERVLGNAGADRLFACDFLIAGVESYEKNGYFQSGKIINIDHHSDASSVTRQISSTNLVIEYLKNGEKILDSDLILTHHVDCDSVLSTLILKGILKPEQRFGRAAIAADHTGEADGIADLLQAIKRGPEGKDGDTATALENQDRFNYVVRNLENFLNGLPIEQSAQAMLDHRLSQRAEVNKLRNNNQFKNAGESLEVVYLPTQPEGRLDPTLLIGGFPEAKIIFTYYNPNPGLPNNYIFNYRLGKKGMEQELRLGEVMEKTSLIYGGRWNGGSNKRKTKGEGSPESPDQAATMLLSALS